MTRLWRGLKNIGSDAKNTKKIEKVTNSRDDNFIAQEELSSRPERSDLLYHLSSLKSPYRMTNHSLRPKRFRRVDAGDPEGRQNRRNESNHSE
jgi:hypothetical protein